MPRTPALTALLALLSACADDKGDDSATDDTGQDTSAPANYTINGTAIDFGLAQNPAAEGLCVEALDPSRVLEGGEAEVLGTATVGAEGAYTLADIPIRDVPTIVLIRDCEGVEPPTVFPTGSPVLPSLEGTVEAGDVVNDVRSVSLGVAAFDRLRTDLGTAGSTVDLTVSGMLFGFVWTADNIPIPGAQITCSSCTVYYGDADDTDGLFATGGVTNTSTSGAGLWVIPGAPVDDYSAVADGYSFMTVTMGAPPSGALFGVAVGE